MNAPDISVLKTKQKIRLEWYETEIRKRSRSLSTIFIELRDDGLKPWQYAHDSYEEYCADIWSLTSRRLQQLAAGESLRTMLSDESPDMALTLNRMNEGQLRALGAVPADKRTEVLKAAVETLPKGERLTAKKIKKAKARVIDNEPDIPEPEKPRCPHCGQVMPK